jgi:two-component system response regulator YesN
VELPEDGFRVVLLAPSMAMEDFVGSRLAMEDIERALCAVCTVDMIISIDQQVILVLTGADPDALERELEKAGITPLLAGISQEGALKDLPKLLLQAREALLHAAFFGECAVILYDNIAQEALPAFDLHSLVQYCDLILSEAQPTRIQVLLKNMLSIISMYAADEAQRRVYWMQLFVALVDRDDAAGRAERMALLPTFASMPEEKAQNLLMRMVTEIACERMKFTSRQIEFLATRMLDAMKKHLEEDDFSLIKLAKEILYANANYLGRVFKRVYRQTFSQALQSLRMERAARLLETETLTVSEVARRTGFGHNTQYFAQVFRSFFGHTPSEHNRQRL